ncbi:S9 family peptidase [Deinococcus sp. QL22]|uniref:alpha/beta hydrolase family protein n=1 Tax=Deinococcus sp. QL22 TaxID=2939437 RepID=UPI0020173EBD|nr:alpha/beta fold hydrolase [Deinococcus sp. QL22]UQN08416.1 alpha/beta fold hydrolase [Deinococcus sp. QL22]
MKKLGWLLPFVLASSGLAIESSVTIAGHIPGTMSLPAQPSGKAPAVLLLHGFASQKDEVGDMYKNLAAQLAAQGVASLRIDFQGSGASKIPFEQMTFTNQVSDAQAAFEYLKGRPEVDAARLGLLGFSMGGGVAIKLAANAANPVKSLALWSSTSSRSLADIESGSRATAEKEGVVDVDLGFTKIKLGKAFYGSIQAQDLEGDIGKFRGNTMLVYGTADPLSGNAPYFLYNLGGKVRNLVLIDGADHIYHVLTDDKSESNQVIDTTVNWFRGL